VAANRRPVWFVKRHLPQRHKDTKKKLEIKNFVTWCLSGEKLKGWTNE
jgi:sugar (pentulose or hexulose) kinase